MYRSRHSLNRAHLKRILTEYFAYYHDDRTHLGLEKNTPNSRSVEPKPAGKYRMIALSRVGGLHHRYTWKKAALTSEYSVFCKS